MRVDVLVTDRGRPVTGLRAEDFEIRDNGVPQRIEIVSFEQMPLNVMLALDVSGSVAGQRYAQLSDAARAFVGVLAPGDTVGLLTFSNDVSVRTPLTADFSKVHVASQQLTTTGETGLVDASYTALVLAEAGIGRPLAIVFSDGADTASFLRAEDVLATARRADTVVYGIVSGNSGGDDFLTTLAEHTGGSVLRVQSTTELAATMTRGLTEFRHRYLLSYTPTGFSGPGWHRLEVRVKGRQFAVRAKPGYLSR